MSQAVARCLRRRLGLGGPNEVGTRLLGGLVSCITIVFACTILYYAVLGRFFGGAVRRLSLFFIIGLPFAA